MRYNILCIIGYNSVGQSSNTDKLSLEKQERFWTTETDNDKTISPKIRRCSTALYLHLLTEHLYWILKEMTKASGQVTTKKLLELPTRL